MVCLSLKQHGRKLLVAGNILSAILLPTVSWAQAMSQNTLETVAHPAFLQVIVNSPADGPVQPDGSLTLREAIELTNGTLLLDALSPEEQQQVNARSSDSQIHFDLSEGDTTIELSSLLPAIAQPHLTIDGTTQPGYDATLSATAEIEIPIPVVTIRPKNEVEVFRGLTISTDDVTVRGLNLYGFTSRSQITQSTPPADIFITHRPASLNRQTTLPLGANRSAVGNNVVSLTPPMDVVIEQNWLGLTSAGDMPAIPSSFGVSVFDSAGTTIQRNRIEYHNGSAIISGRQADNLQVLDNIIVGNGLSGMPDAIRLDGQVYDGLISGNLICGNDGSGVFLFKPDGDVTISNNAIRFNGQRLRRAAIYLMGDDHRVLDNDIAHQKGSGVVVTAFGQGPNTQSRRNMITGNRFDSNEGLSIDLNARRDRTPQTFQTGDGPNPQRNSHNRRQDTANSAVNAPQFVSSEFFIINGNAIIRGQADPHSEIQLYRSVGFSGDYGPLTEPLAITQTNEIGTFEFVLDDMQGGEVLSAITTDPRYGTSEPAKNTLVRTLFQETTPTLVGSAIFPSTSASTMPPRVPPTMPPTNAQCTTPPLPPVLPEPTPLPPILPPAPDNIQLEVPRNVHFGLDQDFISDGSASVLDKIALVLEQFPSIVVDLHGHTDSRASVAYNQDLARRRAENARRYLLSKGIGVERMTIRSLGETELLVTESDRVNYARNRRVEFVFQDLRGAAITVINQEEDLQIEP